MFLGCACWCRCWCASTVDDGKGLLSSLALVGSGVRAGDTVWCRIAGFQVGLGDGVAICRVTVQGAWVPQLAFSVPVPQVYCVPKHQRHLSPSPVSTRPSATRRHLGSRSHILAKSRRSKSLLGRMKRQTRCCLTYDLLCHNRRLQHTHSFPRHQQRGSAGCQGACVDCCKAVGSETLRFGAKGAEALVSTSPAQPNISRGLVAGDRGSGSQHQSIPQSSTPHASPLFVLPQYPKPRRFLNRRPLCHQRRRLLWVVRLWLINSVRILSVRRTLYASCLGGCQRLSRVMSFRYISFGVSVFSLQSKNRIIGIKLPVLQCESLQGIRVQVRN